MPHHIVHLQRTLQLKFRAYHWCWKHKKLNRDLYIYLNSAHQRISSRDWQIPMYHWMRKKKGGRKGGDESCLENICSLKWCVPKTCIWVLREKSSMSPLSAPGDIKNQPTFITSPMNKHRKCNTLPTASRTIQDNLLSNFGT
jgi:hypothetical protein